MADRYQPWDDVTVTDAVEAYSVDLRTCTDCGAVVRRTEVHDAWHEQQARTTQEARP